MDSLKGVEMVNALPAALNHNLTEALATAYTAGHQLDFAGRRPRPYRSLDLPIYPFQRRAYWFPATTVPAPKGRPTATGSSPAEAERTTP
jgi:acyl transferase domain-containing protein